MQLTYSSALASRRGHFFYQLLVASLSLLLCLPTFAEKQRDKAGKTEIVAPDLAYYAAENDTLITIAKKFTDKQTHWEAIGKFNQIGNDRAIPIGTKIIIPAALLAEQSVQATVVALAGAVSETPVKGTERALALGDKVSEASVINTSKNGFLTLELPDASRVSIPSNSQVALVKLKMTKFTQSPRTEVKLLQGRVESKVNSLQSNKGRFEVTSKLAVAGVRGTHFRVGVNEQGIGNEVLEGGVAVGQAQKAASLTLAAGQGNIVTSSGVGKAIPLLPAPTLTPEFALQERTTLQFNVLPVAEARSYRAQISKDAAAQDVIAEVQSTQTQFKFTQIEDGNYFIRVTAIDAHQLEGMPSVFPFKLKARPEPPFPLAPKHKASAESVNFKWTQTEAAKHYHLQVAKDAQFQHIVQDQAQVSASEWASSQLSKGTYFWRVATVIDQAGQVDQGPYSQPQGFTVVETTSLPEFKDSGELNLNFAWAGELGQSFLVQVAQDAQFQKLIFNQELDLPKLDLARPPAGTYYIRVRTTDADRFRGEFSRPQKFEIESQWTTSYGAPVNSISGSLKQDR